MTKDNSSIPALSRNCNPAKGGKARRPAVNNYSYSAVLRKMSLIINLRVKGKINDGFLFSQSFYLNFTREVTTKTILQE